MQNAFMNAAKFYLKHENLRHLTYMFLDVFAAAAKVCPRCQGNIEKVKDIAFLLTQSLLL